MMNKLNQLERKFQYLDRLIELKESQLNDPDSYNEEINKLKSRRDFYIRQYRKITHPADHRRRMAVFRTITTV